MKMRAGRQAGRAYVTDHLAHSHVAAGPEVISIYRWPLERYCGDDPNRIRAQVLATVLHELAHHFGIDHDDMPEWVK